MRICKRKEFLQLPAGTIYCKGGEYFFDNLYIKADTWENDWVCLDFCWPEGKDSEECFEKLADSIETGSSFDMNESFGRDGCFDETELFLVFEINDLIKVKTYIEDAIALGNLPAGGTK